MIALNTFLTCAPFSTGANNQGGAAAISTVERMRVGGQGSGNKGRIGLFKIKQEIAKCNRNRP